MTQPIYASSVVSPSATTATPSSSGARLVAVDGRPLPLESTRLECEAGGGIARSVLRQRFRNDGREALEVTYLLPLPSDGAVSGYSFELDGVVTRGVVESAELAREQYEEALMQGKSAALLEQERSSAFRQSLGNLPPGKSVDISVTIDHPLAWLGTGWELRFPTVVAPRYQAGSATSSTVPIAVQDEHGPGITAEHQTQLAITDQVTRAPSSPSHTLALQSDAETTRVLVTGASLDRDLVVRWEVSGQAPGVRLETARLSAENPRGSVQFGLLTVTPAALEPAPVARDLIVLLDTSGSMGGEPLAQAVRIVSELVRSLGERDRLELIEFGTVPRRWKREPVDATVQHRQEALSWLRSLQAGGGTEMLSGLEEALASLRSGALRQVVLVTDGLIGFERAILKRISERLPPSCRLHTVGIGHGTNRSLLEPAARTGRGVEVIVAPGEDVEPACARILAGTARPALVNLRVSGSALRGAPERLPDLYAGAPALVPLALSAAGGVLEIEAETAAGRYSQQVQVAPREAATGAARVAALFARERAKDLELAYAAGSNDDVDRELTALGLDFQIATRLTSWIAVSEGATVDPKLGTRRVEQPHLLAAGVSAEGLGLRSRLFAEVVPGGFVAARMRVGAPAPMAPMAAAPPAAAAAKSSAGVIGRTLGALRGFRDMRSGGADEERTRSAPIAPERRRGTLRVVNERSLVVTIAFDRRDAWLLPKQWTLRLENGELLPLEIDEQHSTQDGTIDAGQEVRLVFALSGKLPAAAKLLISRGVPLTWEIALSR
jgi:Ca-activated chloride channel family protein